MKIKTLLAAVALTVAGVTPAFAGVAGMADLSISQLLVVDPVTGNPSPIAPSIQITSDSRTGTADSNYNGVVGTGAGAGSITDIRTDGTPAAVDVAYRCAGPSCGNINTIYPGGAENNAGTNFLTNQGNYALGDMNIQGNALVGGASGLTRGDTSADFADAIGGANATILNGVSVVTNFTAGATASLAFALDYDAFVRVFVDPLLPAGYDTLASAGITFSLTLRNTTTGTTLLQWTPDELNRGLLAENASQNAVHDFEGTITSDAFTVIGGNTYSLVISQASNSAIQLNAVPEPESLLLVGLGLLAMGVTVRRKRLQ
ncbi:EDSAP-1 family PEP-CTERM protein [Massilia sp. METH4]|uniref:EDSAP-1 family PEP-CTERM protein n=1 Tax=Massilia sp. METH4 TaxID=3123041 RepID=UPI0030D22691